ncbi:hypothetical protein INT43_008073 [Umbelopsis isabellina]|uniref:protein-serine/threonine phosphatase n=1 Tax=Mortierella isabellina TaxID=91625 RepID=A0A8H7PD57_MORIS|nr:hypothetical protein INT43_008073 [Umbelopsis isabellina]
MMNVSSILNDVPPTRKNEKKTAILSMAAQLQYNISVGAKRPRNEYKTVIAGPDHSSAYPVKQVLPQSTSKVLTPEELLNIKCPRFLPAITQSPSEWRPQLTLPSSNDSIPLVTREILHKPGDPKLLLEENYDVPGAVPRSFFVVMAHRGITHSFVFDFPDHAWFHDLAGFRKSAYIVLRCEQGHLWELHLKPARDKANLFGYLCKHSDMLRIIKEQQEGLLRQRRLPLVLDLDDTLVRLVGNETGRYVPDNQLHLCQDRVRTLRDGRRVVLTDHVYEFLDWAKNYYDISVCSLGDQNYVDMVISVLDPTHTRIRGIYYSARSEYEYICKSTDSRRPSKDLLALYAFCAVNDKAPGCGFSLPLIVDDLTHMWPAEQHDNIIVVKEKKNAPVWTVCLFPMVQTALGYVHTEFYRQLDSWYNKQQEAEVKGVTFTKDPPTAVGIYKEFLRNGLRDQIANGPPS